MLRKTSPHALCACWTLLQSTDHHFGTEVFLHRVRQHLDQPALVLEDSALNGPGRGT